MTTISKYLTLEHRHCDDLFVAAESAVARCEWPVAEAHFGAFHADMDAHLGREETVLFPAFEAQTGSDMGPTRVMRMEHTQMRSLMQEMETAIHDRQARDFLGLADTLLIMMQQHNMKEEQMLYPMSDRALPDCDQLVERMRHTDAGRPVPAATAAPVP